MTYVDGFVIAVPAANRDAFIKHAQTADPVFMELGAIQIIESWEDDVPDGKLTDFRRAVQATADEKVAFAFVVWPSKEVRDAAMAELTRKMEAGTDPRMSMKDNPPPFDGKRMIFGGFTPVVELRA